MLTWVFATAGLLVAGFVKGTTGLGFPLIATPIVALVVDLRTTYALLVLPNMVMDILQILRREPPWALWRRLLPLFVATAVGVFLGTQIFLVISARAVYAWMAVMISLFLASAWLRLDLRVSPKQERWMGPAAGFLGGLLNGIANVPGPPIVIYLLGLELEKRNFVKALASALFVTKASQMAAISQSGLVTGGILLASSGLTILALGGFWAGLQVQDRIPQRAFLRCLYLLLACMAGYYAFRAL